MEADTPEVQKAGCNRLVRWFYRDSYTIVGWLTFLIIVIDEWRGYVGKHEAIYLLGSRRISDPGFLANDLTWANLSPTTFLYDHMLAPLWGLFGDFGIVVTGRFVVWFLFAWALTLLARTLRLPVWSAVAGFVIWILWDQSLAFCGRLFEGLQPKLFGYVLIFLSLAFLMRGQTARAGIASGVATVFHIIIGGWGWLALALTMLINRKLFSWRQVGIFLFSSLMLIAPLVLAVGLFHIGEVSSDEQNLMNRIYVTFASPHCCDPEFFMKPDTWMRALVIFIFAPLVISRWPHKSQARILAVFTLMLIFFFIAGILASQLQFYWLLKLFPFQLANALPALFLFIMCLALVGANRPKNPAGQAVVIIGIIACTWLIYDRDVIPDRLVKTQKKFLHEVRSEAPGESRYGKRISASRQKFYEWVRADTPRDSIFITPYLPEFWIYAERAQVAAFRRPPYDIRLIEWKDRLDAINRYRPFAGRGFQIREQLTRNQGQLSREELVRMRELYGATHYVTRLRRTDLENYQLYDGDKYFAYRVPDE